MSKKKTDAKPAPRPAGPTATFPGLAPGIQLPAGVQIQRQAPPFPPDLERQLQQARKGRRFLIVVVQADEQGSLTCDSTRAADFNPDWLLRAWRTVQDQITSGSLSSPPAPKE